MNKKLWLVIETFLAVVCVISAIIASVHQQIVLFPLTVLIILNLIHREQLKKWYDTSIEQLIKSIDQKVSVSEFDYLNQEFQISLDELESINLQETNNIQDKIINFDDNLKSVKSELITDYKQYSQNVNHIFEEIQGLEDKLQEKYDFFQKTKIGSLSYLQTEFKNIQNDLAYLKIYSENQKHDLIALMTEKYKAYIAHVRELLVPIKERQDYLENIYHIKQEQIKLQIGQLNVNLNDSKKQQEDDFLHFNKLMVNPVYKRQLYWNDNDEEFNPEISRNEMKNVDNVLSDEESIKIEMLEQNIAEKLLNQDEKINQLIESNKIEQETLENIVKRDLKQQKEAIEYLDFSVEQINKFLNDFDNQSTQLNQLDDQFYQLLQNKIQKLLNKIYVHKIKPLEDERDTMNKNLHHINNKLKKIEDVLNLKVFKNTSNIKKLQEDFKLQLANILNLIESLSMSLEKLENSNTNKKY